MGHAQRRACLPTHAACSAARRRPPARLRLQDAREARAEVSQLKARLAKVEGEKREAVSHLAHVRALNDALQVQVRAVCRGGAAGSGRGRCGAPHAQSLFARPRLRSTHPSHPPPAIALPCPQLEDTTATFNDALSTAASILTQIDEVEAGAPTPAPIPAADEDSASSDEEGASRPLLPPRPPRRTPRPRPPPRQRPARSSSSRDAAAASRLVLRRPAAAAAKGAPRAASDAAHPAHRLSLSSPLLPARAAGRAIAPGLPRAHPLQVAPRGGPGWPLAGRARSFALC